MKLIPEQISYLRKRQAELKKSIAGYKDYLTSRDITSSDYSARAVIGDSVIDEQYQRENTSYNEITSILTTAEYVTERDTDSVQIGTKFIIGYPNMSDTKAVILTDAMFTLMTNRDFVSCSGPVGKSVLGKKEGETIQYSLPGTSRVGNRVVAIVKEIKKDPKEYLHFIREKEFKNRMSKTERRRRREHPESVQRIQDITESQKLLLLIEKERLERKAKDIHTIRRLAHINSILAKADIATPPTDGTIGIGSTFDVIITDGEKSETRTYEMINNAVSDELEDAYVEKIGVVGSKIYGLKTNDKFSFRKDGKTYKGAILNIVEPQKSASIQYKK